MRSAMRILAANKNFFNSFHHRERIVCRFGILGELCPCQLEINPSFDNEKHYLSQRKLNANLKAS